MTYAERRKIIEVVHCKTWAEYRDAVSKLRGCVYPIKGELGNEIGVTHGIVGMWTDIFAPSLCGSQTTI